MLRTLYKSANPSAVVNTGHPEDLRDAEYRQVSLRHLGERIGGGPFTVKVSQGWWDEAAQGPIHHNKLFEGTYETRDEAVASFDSQLQHLIAEGYVHSFGIDFIEGGQTYEKLSSE